MRRAWAIGSNVNVSEFDPSSSNGGTTRLIRTIQDFQRKLGQRIGQLKENLPMKLLFFLVGFYSATAFSTVIGQTGDWDILSAALAVAVVEGIGALMYKASLQVVNKIRSLITMFNYWKAGLLLGLFLDSFKYEVDNMTGLLNPVDFAVVVLHIIFSSRFKMTDRESIEVSDRSSLLVGTLIRRWVFFSISPSAQVSV